MDVIYIIDGLIIVVIAIYFQIWILSITTLSSETSPYLVKYFTLSAQLQNSSLSDSERASLNSQMDENDKGLLPKIVEIVSVFESFILQATIFSLYFIKNLCQMLFAKLRNKKVLLVSPEIVINFLSFLI